MISTAFPHAVELLASGAGIVVPQRDPVALAAAIERQALSQSGEPLAVGALPGQPAAWKPWFPVIDYSRCIRRPQRRPVSLRASWSTG